ncbi:MAG: hypothetical protein ACTS44_01000 [Candidatus Hodgkinia cicadicola]
MKSFRLTNLPKPSVGTSVEGFGVLAKWFVNVEIRFDWWKVELLIEGTSVWNTTEVHNVKFVNSEEC